jgi:hypothetical protein
MWTLCIVFQTPAQESFSGLHTPEGHKAQAFENQTLGANFVSQNPRLLLACAYQWTGVAQLDDTAVSTRVLIHDLIHRLSEPSDVLFDDFG